MSVIVQTLLNKNEKKICVKLGNPALSKIKRNRIKFAFLIQTKKISVFLINSPIKIAYKPVKGLESFGRTAKQRLLLYVQKLQKAKHFIVL